MRRAIFFQGIIVLLILVIGVILFSWPSPQPQSIPFSETGVLIINNPGFDPDVWYLSYEMPGQPGLSAKLRFTDQSACSGGVLSSPCDPAQFSPGMRATVTGERQGSAVTVETLSLASTTETGQRIKLYFYNPQLDQGPGGAQCTRNGLVAVERVIPKTTTPLTDSIKLLLRGELSADERAEGITTEFPLPGVSLVSASIRDGVATLTFSDPLNKTGGGSCRVAILWAQIEATANQFSTISSVRFEPEELFQP